MTQIEEIEDFNNNFRIRLFMLVNPASGDNDVVVSLSGSSTVNSAATSFTGAKQSDQPHTTEGNWSTNTTSLTTSTTTTVDGCWLVGFSQGSDLSGGSNTVVRGDADSNNMHDSNSDQTPAGSHSQVLNRSGSGLLRTVMASFEPAESTKNPLFAFAGL